jgi:hypothetical protein
VALVAAVLFEGVKRLLALFFGERFGWHMTRPVVDPLVADTAAQHPEQPFAVGSQLDGASGDGLEVILSLTGQLIAYAGRFGVLELLVLLRGHAMDGDVSGCGAAGEDEGNDPERENCPKFVGIFATNFPSGKAAHHNTSRNV